MESMTGGAGTVLGGMMGMGQGWIDKNIRRDERNETNQMNLENMYGTANWRRKQNLLMQKESYKQMIESMREEGLNLGLLYGGSGVGGQTNASVNNETPTGNQGSWSGGQALQGMAIGSQTAVQIAQAENLKADARLKNVQADKTEGADTEKTEAETGSLLQDINESKAREALTNYSAEIRRIDMELEQNTDYNSARFVNMLSSADKASAEAVSAVTQSNIDTETKNSKITIIREQAISVHLENLLKEANIDKTHQEIDKMAKEIVKMDNDMKNQNKSLELQEIKMYIDAVIGGIGAITNLVGLGKMATLLKNTKGEAPTKTITTKYNAKGEYSGQTTTVRRK